MSKQEANQTFTIHSPNSDTVTILQGEALPQREPKNVGVKGTIDSVGNYLEKRVDVIPQEKCMILVNRDHLSITLFVREKDPYGDLIAGELKKHSDLEKWGINTGEQWTAKELSEFVKMNRSCFKSNETAMKLSKELQDLKVNINKEIERRDNNRGDYKAMVAQQVIKSNVPESFALNVPIFKGQPQKEFNVEIYISPDTFSCSLVSPELNEMIHSVRDSYIDKEIDRIKEIAPDIVIIEE